MLTEVFNPDSAFFGYFNTKILTLKSYLFTAVIIAVAVTSKAQNYNNIEFTENKGQWDASVRYMGKVTNGAFYIRDKGFTVVQHNAADMAVLNKMMHGQTADGRMTNITDEITVRSHSWNVDFVGASPNMRVIPDKSVDTYSNYFIGNDPSKWASNCRIFQAITLEEVYPGVDVRYYTSNEVLKYDIIVKPGGDISKIALRYDGVNGIKVNNKELVLSTSLGEMRESSPFTYQTDMKGRREVSSKYVVKDNIVRFDVKGYDPNTTVVIDPSIVFCSFSGSTSDNWGFTATYGPDGAMFGGGIVFGPQFNPSPGAYQTTYGGGSGSSAVDMGIIKLTPDGRNRVYATYLGGGGNEQPHSLVVDNAGNLIIAGRSNSTNYPVSNTALSGTGFDIVVTKLNASGGNYIGSRKIGGSADDGVNISTTRSLQSLQRNYGDDGRSEVIIDGAGNIYVASCTQSGNFPVTAGSFQNTFGGGQDGVLLKFSPDLSTLVFASFMGGTRNDAAYVLALAPDGSIFVAGGTESNNFFPAGVTAGTIGTAHHNTGANDPIDGFLAVINPTGTSWVRGAYIGTTGIDQVFGVQFDNKGFPYIMGQTTGTWPVTPGTPTYGSANGKQFIVKLQPNLSAYVYSTVFGTNSVTPNISPTAFLVDRCENVYISGWGGHYDPSNPYGSAGTNGLPITAGAFKSTTDNRDFYFFVLQKDAVQQLFGSFFGEQNAPQGGGDHVDGGTSRFDNNGVIYQAICANCRLTEPPPQFPVTLGAYSTTNNASNARNSAGCNLAMLKIRMDLAGVDGGIRSSIDGIRDTAGCVPLTVDFIDTVGNAQSYEWYFGYVPGNPPDLTTTTPTAQWTFNTVGTFRVMLVAIDPTTCNVRDSSYMNIRVGNLEADVDFTYAKSGPDCRSLQYTFTNTSVPPPSRLFTDTSFVWNFGDGSPLVIAGMNPVTHVFPTPGPYTVILTLKDTAYCNNPDADTALINVADVVRAAFTTPATGCLQYSAEFDNTSLAGESWLWDFGDNTTSTEFEPVHVYTAPGTYNVVLVAYNANTCNRTDTARFTITVFDSPIPSFSTLPLTPQVNTPVTFNNTSSPDAVRFRWDFGDGDTLLTTSRAPVDHQYQSSGTFNACLTAYNQIGCDSTVCLPVVAIIDPLVDVPNAFTPNSGDINSIVLVKGFGIAKMHFTIWNRWGQKVFETNNRNQGWDGRVKGVVQPMDVYAYTLSIEFSDGTKTTKKGDITLIR